MTVDPALVEAGQRAVAAGRADSVSGWVSAALEDRILREHKLALLAAAVADYEDEFGEITVEEIARQRRSDSEDARVVRGRRLPATRTTKSA